MRAYVGRGGDGESIVSEKSNDPQGKPAGFLECDDRLAAYPTFQNRQMQAQARRVRDRYQRLAERPSTAGAKRWCLPS